MVTLVFKKHFTKGNLAGLTITDHLPFVSVERTHKWIENVLNNTGLDWRIAKVRGDELAEMVFDADNPLEACIDQFEQWYERVK